MKLSGLAMCCLGVMLCSLVAATPGRCQTDDLTAGLNSWNVAYEIYQVQPNDTVENIAARFGVSAERIRAVNRLDESSRLAPGQSLAIILPGRPRPRREESAAVEPSAALEQAEQPTTFPQPRYATVGRACTITSVRPPAYGRALWQCDPGDRVVVSQQQGDYYGVIMLGGSTGWIPSGAVTLTDDTLSTDDLSRMLQAGEGRMDVVYEAMRYLGTPYRYGGSLPRNVDCSLLVQTAFGRHGVRLPRTAAEQCEVGLSVSTENLQPGDRLYFVNRSGRISHTGIYMGNGQFIHASSNRGCVAIDSLSTPYYTSRLYGARRL